MTANVEERRIVEADHQGNLDLAISLATQQILQVSPNLAIDERIRRYVRLARVLRHRGLNDDLRRSQDAASQAVRLATLPIAAPRLLPPARLSLASSRLALCDASGCRSIAQAYVGPGDYAAPEIASWAWRLLGQEALARASVFEAVAALLNAVAEEQQLLQPAGADTTRVLLLHAFSRAGHVLNADKVARNTDPGRMPPLRRMAFLLACGEHEHRSGRIDKALETLDQAEQLLAQTSGLNHMKVTLHQLRASCLDDWRLCDAAQQERHQARALKAETLQPARKVPSTIALEHRPTQLSPVPLAGCRDLERPALELVKDFSRLRPLKSKHAQILERAVSRLQGVPGEDRSEALALVEVGCLLAEGPREVHSTAERLLRRALARLEYLEATDLWKARCQGALGCLLAETKKKEALNLLIAAVKGLSAQRYCMKRRSYRSTWRAAAEHPPFESAIELAYSLKRDDIAADLIIHSRLSGVISPTTQQRNPANPDRVEEVPLAQVPTLTYINGATSELGGPGCCRLL